METVWPEVRLGACEGGQAGVDLCSPSSLYEDSSALWADALTFCAWKAVGVSFQLLKNDWQSCM